MSAARDSTPTAAAGQAGPTGSIAPALHVEPVRVAWADTDAGGRIHWTAVFRWAELAEHALLRRLGRHPSEAGPYPRRASDVVYQQALEFEDEVEVHLGVSTLGRTSVTFAWVITRDGVICVEGHHTVVHVGPDGRAAPWPDYLRRGLRVTHPAP